MKPQWKQKLKRILYKMLNYLPYYRKLIKIEGCINSNKEGIDNITNNLLKSLEEKNEQVNIINDKCTTLNKLVKDLRPKPYTQYENIIGEKFEINKKSKTFKYHIPLADYFNKLKKYLLKTDILLDIGCGIRPQTLFEPRVHLCIEPYKEYRNIVKPLFPNKKSSFIFIKTDALSGIKLLDDNSVDSVYMIDLIEHLDKKDGLELLKEADRVARKQIFVFTPFGFYPQHYEKTDSNDAWGLSGTKFQEHLSGWLPEDFGEGWDFHICVDAHDAFDPKERAAGKKYSALSAIKTKLFTGFEEQENTPQFMKDIY